MKSLAFASKPQVFENCSVLGSRTALFFCSLKILLENAINLAENLRTPFLLSSIGDHLKKNFEDVFFGDRLKKILIFLEHLRLCPWSLTLASNIPVLALRGLSFAWTSNFFVFLVLVLALSLVSSTPPLVNKVNYE